MVAITSSLEVLPTSFREFYVYYLATHRRLWTKRLHLIGTIVGLVGAVLAAIRGRAIGVVLSAAAGLAICWTGDVVVEEKRPASFQYPFWSVQANFKMLKGMMRDEGIDC